MTLSFKPQFVTPILKGTKIHTIRKDIGCRWEAGRKIHFATGVRTKNHWCFKEGECTGIQSIGIFNHELAANRPHLLKYPTVIIGNSLLSDEQIEQLARNDGFDSAESFFQWFNEEFYGVIIHWTDFRYGPHYRRVGSERFECKGCGKDTFIDNKDYYMVTHEVWEKHGVGDGMLCMGCMEDRLGHKLTKNEILDCLLNTEMNEYTRSILNSTTDEKA